MQQRSPTLEGFRTIFRRPSFGFAEIAWRWSFGAATGVLLAFSFFEYLDTLPVSNSDLLLLRTRQPILISRAMLDIFHGSSFRLGETVAVLALALGIAWVVIASLGRAATVSALVTHFRDSDAAASLQHDGQRWRLPSVFALNVFRLGAALAAIVGCLAAVLLGAASSRPSQPSPGSAFLIALTVIMLVWVAWSIVNWFLSLAAIFVVAHGQDTFSSMAAVVDLCQTRPGSVFAAATWFGLAHITAFVVASSAIGFPLGFAAVLPSAAVLGGVLLLTLLYLAIADFIYIGRLAAYVAMVELPESPAVLSGLGPAPENAGRPTDRTSLGETRVDPSELILSDVPL
jgi:hypothetical protein